MKEMREGNAELDLMLLRDEVFALVSKGRSCFSDCNKKEKRELIRNHLTAHRVSFNEISQSLLEEEVTVKRFNFEFQVDLKEDEYYQYSDSEIDDLFIDYIFDNDHPVSHIFNDSYIEYIEDYFVYYFDTELYHLKSASKNDYSFELSNLTFGEALWII